MRVHALVLTLFTVMVPAYPAAEARQELVPARLLSEELPPLPNPNVVAGGEVILEVTVDRGGQVTDMTPLRVTAPYAELVAPAVAAWRFVPAQEHPGDATPVEVAARVLVAAVYRPPAFFDTPTPGDPPRDVSAPSPDVPGLLRLVPPVHPPATQAEGVVLVEVPVAASGVAAAPRVVAESQPGFAGAALEAARWLEFRGARWRGRPAPAYVYVIYGFRQPVMPAPLLPPR